MSRKPIAPVAMSREDVEAIYEKSLSTLPQIIKDVLTSDADARAARKWLAVLQRAKRKGWRFE